MDELLFSYADPSQPALARAVIRAVERATGQPRLKRMYMDFRRSAGPAPDFFDEAVRRLDLRIGLAASDLDRIPAEGPLVVVANHPFGVLDGIALSWIVGRRRPDFRVLTNAVLLRAPEAAPFLLPVDFAETAEALRTNIATRAAARRHLDAGGCVAVFPAGGVSTAPDRLGRRPAEDAEWQAFTGQLVQKSRATVLPVFFAGQNSRLFQIASHIHPALRLSLIFKEVRDRIGTTLPVAIGEAIPFADVAALTDRRALARHFREVTYALEDRLAGSPPSRLPRRRGAAGFPGARNPSVGDASPQPDAA